MKANTYTQKQIESAAKRIAYRVVTSFNKARQLQREFDLRFNFDRAVKSRVQEIIPTINEQDIKAKIKARRQAKCQEFSNALSNGIVKDYINNKDSLKAIACDRLIFIGGRNHWAKNENDEKILSILKNKYYAKG